MSRVFDALCSGALGLQAPESLTYKALGLTTVRLPEMADATEGYGQCFCWPFGCSRMWILGAVGVQEGVYRV